MKLKAGIDVGSTTVKLVILNEKNETIFAKYERHFSDVKKATSKILTEGKEVIKDTPVSLQITGSAGWV